jgi:lambda family phage tail tape measure protein
MAMDMTVGMRIAASVTGGSSVDDLRKSVDKLNGSASGITTAFATAGNMLKGFIGLAAIREVANYSMELFKAADALDELSQRTGTSATLLSQLQQSGQMAGVSIESIATGMKKLSVQLVESQNGSKEAAKGFKALGLDPNQFKNSEEAMAAIADRFIDMEDGANKVAIAQALMGKSGEANIPWLNQGSESMKKFASVFSPQFIGMSAAFTDQIDELGFNFRRASATVIETFLPTLVQVFQSFNALTNTKSEFIGFFDLLAEGFRMVAAAAQIVIAGFRQVMEVLSTLYDVSAFTLSGQFDAAGKRIKEGFNNTLEVGKQGIDQFKKLMADSLTFGDGTTQEILARQKAAAGANTPDKKKPSFIPDMSGFGSDEEDKLAKYLKKIDEQEKEQIRKFDVQQRSANERRKDEMNAVNMTAVEYQKLTAAREIDLKASELMVGMTSEKNREELRKVTAELQAQTAAMIELKYHTERTFEFGAKQAFKTYLDEATNLAKQSQQLFTNAFKGMEDALTNFVMTGKLDFKSLADSIIADLVRIAVRQAIMKPLLGAVSGGLGFALPFANGGVMTSNGAMPLQKYAMGGIANSPQLALFGEGSTPEAFVPLPDGRNIPVKMEGGGGSTNNVTVNVSVEGGDSKVASDSAQSQLLGTAISKAVQSELVKQKRPGGLLYGNA